MDRATQALPMDGSVQAPKPDAFDSSHSSVPRSVRFNKLPGTKILLSLALGILGCAPLQANSMSVGLAALQSGTTQQLWPESQGQGTRGLGRRPATTNPAQQNWNGYIPPNGTVRQGTNPAYRVASNPQQGPNQGAQRQDWPVQNQTQPRQFSPYGQGPMATGNANGTGSQGELNQGLQNRFQAPNVDSVDWSNRPTATNPMNGAPVVVPPPELFEASRILARVGSYTVFAGDLLPEINELIETKMAGAPEAMKAVQRERLMEQLLPKIVEQKLLYSDAVEQLPEKSKLEEVLVSIREQFVEVELPKLLEQYKVASASELDALLRNYGGSVRRRREKWAEGQLIGFVIRQNIEIDPEVTHQEMLDEYRENLAQYEIPATVRWKQLMVRFSKHASKQAAFNEIASMGDEVVYGAPFEAVAKRRSDGFNAKDGGLHDWTTQGALKAKEVDKALFELPIGYLSDIIESDQGFHIVQVLDRKQADYVSFREAQVKIRDRLKTKKQEASLAEYVEQVQKRVPVWTILDAEQAN